jgi:hypothetical protein
VARVLLQVQQQGPVLREQPEQEPRQEQPQQEQLPPVPLQRARPPPLVAQQPQERQPVLPPAQVLPQQRAQLLVHGAAQLGWGSARRSVCWQANFSKE